MHNRSSLSQKNAELPCSTRSNPTIRDMSFPIPNPPLNWEINCSPSSRFFFFFTSKNNMSEHLVRFQCLWLGWLKALQPETSCRVDPTEKAKFRRDNKKQVFFPSFFCGMCRNNSSTEACFVELWVVVLCWCVNLCFCHQSLQRNPSMVYLLQ